MAASFDVPCVACCLFFFIALTISKPFDVCRYSVSLCGSTLLHPTDRAILQELMAKASLIYADDWNVSLTCAKGWRGVCTDKNGRVTELSLNIQFGEYPNSFGRLEKLLYLKFDNYYFLNSLPPTLGSLTNLRQLFINSGTIYTLPPSFASLSKLTHLRLACSVDESILPTISKFTNLIHLELKDSRFTFLPTDAFSSLKKLVNLYIVNNRYLRFNPIPSFKGLSSLKILDLRGNRFTGAIPTSFALLKNLTTLLLDGNSLCGNIPSNLSKLPELRTLNVTDNFLTGKVPSEIVRKFCGKLPYPFSGNCFTSSNACGKSKEAYLCANGCNIIPGATKNIVPFASLDLSLSSSTFGDAYLAADGSAGFGKFSSQTCVRTEREVDPYLRIQFYEVHHVKTVQLYNRLDCCGNWLNGVQVYVGKDTYRDDKYNTTGNVPCVNPNFTYGSNRTGFPLTVTCNKKGNIVIVVIPGRDKILSLCEVAVFEK